MQANMKPYIKDFDKIIKPQKIAILAGREIDVTKVSSRMAIELARYTDRLKSGEMKSEESLSEMVDLVAKICKVKNPDIDAEWILDNADIDQLTEFSKFVLGMGGDEKKTEETEEAKA